MGLEGVYELQGSLLLNSQCRCHIMKQGRQPEVLSGYARLRAAGTGRYVRIQWR